VPSVSVSVAGLELDPAVVVADITIRSGRSRADDGLSAASTTITVLSPDPSGVDVGIGDVLAIVVDGTPRFSGRIAEITRAALEDPAGSSYTLVAVGAIARLGRILIPLPRPAESAAARAQAVFTAAAIPIVIEGGQGDSYMLAVMGEPGDDPVSASELIGGLMADTGAVVADRGDGTVLVQFLDSRISADVWAPDPERTHVDLEWEQSDDLVNEIVVDWPGGAPVTSSSPGSVTRYDRHSVKLSTGLGSHAAALQRGSSIIARLAFPSWQVGRVETWDSGILAHGIGALITLEPLPGSSPVPGSSWIGVLEGWIESYGPDAYGNLAGSWELAISDRQHSSETLSWANVSPESLRWLDVNPETSWSEAVSNENLQ
jgi:hypothetical protein